MIIVLKVVCKNIWEISEIIFISGLRAKLKKVQKQKKYSGLYPKINEHHNNCNKNCVQVFTENSCRKNSLISLNSNFNLNPEIIRFERHMARVVVLAVFSVFSQSSVFLYPEQFGKWLSIDFFGHTMQSFHNTPQMLFLNRKLQPLNRAFLLHKFSNHRQIILMS